MSPNNAICIGVSPICCPVVRSLRCCKVCGRLAGGERDRVFCGSFPSGSVVVIQEAISFIDCSHWIIPGRATSCEESICAAALETIHQYNSLNEQSCPYQDVACVSPELYPTAQSLSQTQANALSSTHESSASSPPYAKPFGPNGAAFASKCKSLSATQRPCPEQSLGHATAHTVARP